MSTDPSIPDHTAVRVALWRALHLELDAPPHVLADDIAARLVDPAPDWRERPDMHPVTTAGLRAAIVARARFVEDLLTEEIERGVGQYVVLGAGLDTFAQRRPDVTSRLTIFEIEQPATQAWKHRRLLELGYLVPDQLRFVPVDFERDQPWWEQLLAAGFDPQQPAVVASTGVSMYLTKSTTKAVLTRLAGLAPGSTLAMTFLLTPDLIASRDRAILRTSQDGAHSAGTPFVSLYTPHEITAMAQEAGFINPRHVAGATIAQRYFTGRPDDLYPATGEDFLVATIS